MILFYILLLSVHQFFALSLVVGPASFNDFVGQPAGDLY